MNSYRMVGFFFFVWTCLCLNGGAADQWSIATIAGIGHPGSDGDGGAAIDAEMNNPFGIVRGPDDAIRRGWQSIYR